MVRSIAYRYKVVISSEDNISVSIEFESPNQLSDEEQVDKVKEILVAVNDGVEMGTADVDVQPAEVLQVETTTNTTIYEP
ncbi:MAG TPA: hypothetical protein VGB98_02320 [Pyrinomonadaceae bacterium]